MKLIVTYNDGAKETVVCDSYTERSDWLNFIRSSITVLSIRVHAIRNLRYVLD